MSGCEFRQVIKLLKTAECFSRVGPLVRTLRAKIGPESPPPSPDFVNQVSTTQQGDRNWTCPAAKILQVRFPHNRERAAHEDKSLQRFGRHKTPLERAEPKLGCPNYLFLAKHPFFAHNNAMIVIT